jgi:hypothetical protein
MALKKNEYTVKRPSSETTLHFSWTRRKAVDIMAPQSSPPVRIVSQGLRICIAAAMGWGILFIPPFLPAAEITPFYTHN